MLKETLMMHGIKGQKGDCISGMNGLPGPPGMFLKLKRSFILLSNHFAIFLIDLLHRFTRYVLI